MRELLAVELELRRAEGEDPTSGEYCKRFPDRLTMVGQMIGAAAAAAILTQTKAVTPARSVDVSDFVGGVPGYEILEELGRGGMGVVFRARQIELDRIVALKTIRPDCSASEDERRRFRIEAEAAAALDHPNIVPIFEVGEHRGWHFYSMKLVEGGCLARRLAEGLLAPSAAAGLVAQAARAVAAAHRQGILHRDLKPANILIDADGRLHLTDFGLAKRIESDSGLTRSGAVVGTPSYMSPEQASGRTRALTTATDVYSLGAILYQTLTGRPPFRGDSVMDTLDQVRRCEPARPRTFRPGLDRDLETICLKCLEKDPARRYRSADALGDDLDRWLRNEPIAARPTTIWRCAVKWARRRPAVAALTGLVVTVASVGLAGVVTQWRRAEVKSVAAMAAEQVARGEARRAEDNFRLAMDTVDRYLSRVSEDRLLAVPGLQPLRRELLEAASRFYKELADRHQQDPRARAALVAALSRLSRIKADLGASTEAIAAQEEAVRLAALLVAASPTDAAVKARRAEVLEDLGDLHYHFGSAARGVEEVTQARELFANLEQASPGNVEYRRRLAGCDTTLADFHRQRGRMRDAIPLYLKAREVREQLAAGNPTNSDLRDLASVCNNLGMLYRENGQLDLAVDPLRRAIAISSRLAGRRGHSRWRPRPTWSGTRLTTACSSAISVGATRRWRRSAAPPSTPRPSRAQPGRHFLSAFARQYREQCRHVV